MSDVVARMVVMLNEGGASTSQSKDRYGYLRFKFSVDAAANAGYIGQA
jgi:hypothetical protein